MILQINPAIPIHVINKGDGQAHFLIDYGKEDDLCWVVFMDESGECWTINNKFIRAQKNITLGRLLDYQLKENLSIGKCKC